MSVPIDFPRPDSLNPGHPLSLCTFQVPAEIDSKIKTLCRQFFGHQKVFQFTRRTRRDSRYLLGCSSKCNAFLYYELQTIERQRKQGSEKDYIKQYRLMQYNLTHVHRITYTNEIGFSKLEPFIKPPKIIYFPSQESFNSNSTGQGSIPMKYFRFPCRYSDIIRINNELESQWSSRYGGNQIMFPLPYIRQQLPNTFTFYCGIKNYGSMKCNWTMKYHKMKTGNNGRIQELAPKATYRQAIIKHYKKNKQAERKNMESDEESERERDQEKSENEDDFGDIVETDYEYILDLGFTNFQHIHYSLTMYEKKQYMKESQKLIPLKQKKDYVYYLPPQVKNYKKIIDKFEEDKDPVVNSTNKKNDSFEDEAFELNLNNVQNNQIKSGSVSLHSLFAPLFKIIQKNCFDVKFLQEHQTQKVMLKILKDQPQTTSAFNLEHHKVDEESFKKDEQQQDVWEEEKKPTLKEELNTIFKTNDAKDFDDIVIISSKLMRFLCRAYGEVVYVTQIRSSSKQFIQKNWPTFSFLLFAGLSFSQEPIFFGGAICRNLSLSKIEKIFTIFFKYHLKKMKTVIFNDKEQQLIFIARLLKSNLGLNISIISAPLEKNINEGNGFSISSEIDSYAKFDQNTKYIRRTKKYYPFPLTDPILTEMTEPQVHSRIQKNSQIFSKIKNHNREAADFYVTHTNLGSFDNLKKIYVVFARIDKSMAKFKNSSANQVRINLGYKETSDLLCFHELVKLLIHQIRAKNDQWAKKDRKREKCEYYWEILQLASCRKLMTKESFNKLSQQISLASGHNITCSTKTFSLVDDGLYSYVVQIKTKPPKPFHINREIGREQFITIQSSRHYCSCECGMVDRISIPCSHMVKVMIERKIGLLEGPKLGVLINLGIIKPGRTQRGGIRGQKGRPKRF